jgi:hypothetical protein
VTLADPRGTVRLAEKPNQPPRQEAAAEFCRPSGIEGRRIGYTNSSRSFVQSRAVAQNRCDRTICSAASHDV